MKNHRRRIRRFYALLFAAILAVEPAGGLPTVYAAGSGAEIMTMSEADAGSPGHEQTDGENDGTDPETPEPGSIADGENGGTDPETPDLDSIADGENDGIGPETPEPGGIADEENGGANPETPGNGEEEPGTGSGNSGDKDGEGTDAGNPEEKGDDDPGDTGQEEVDGSDGTGGSDPDEEEKTEDDGPYDEEEETEGDESTDAEEEAEDESDPEDTEESPEDEKTKEKILGGFTEMSSGYRLTAEQMQSKQDLAAHLDEISDYQEGVDYVEGQLITFAENAEEAELIAAAYNAEIVQFEYGILTLQLHEEDTVNKAMRAAASEKINLPAVWPNYYRYAFTDDYIEIETQEYDVEEDGEPADGAGTEEPEMPSDEYLEALGYTDPYLQSTNYYYQYHHTIIGSAYAWASGSTGRGIKIAVLDTGVTNQTEVSATNIYGKGNSDSQGHGTHVAGIIGAKANGSMGVGVAPDVTLYSGNVLPNGSGTDADIMSAIRAAQRKNVDVINMSLGGIGYNGSFQTVVNGAYKQGVAIFAASGNDGGVNYNYPACYDHVISVAATNAGNGRSYFSNYGNKVDLSAPGVDIWSTSRTGGNYVSMSGTSMACPVAAGEAAVILSGNADIRNKTGKARVDALESLMKSNTLKVGSGMGSGITLLPKALKLSTAAARPSAPVIRVIPDSTSAAQSVRVTIEAPDNVKVYYTTDGQNPVFRNGEPGNGAVRYTQRFTISNRTKAAVKAVAVNESGMSSAVRSVTYTLKPYVSSITISGVQQIAQGKSIQLKAEVQPAYAANKKVTWELYTSDGRKIDSKEDAALAKEVGISISSGGKVTASGKAKPGNYNVRATSKDAQGRSAAYRITVIDEVKIDSVSLTTIKLSLTLPDEKTYNLGACLDGKCKDGMPVSVSDFKWSSSNSAVARVSTSGTVTAVRPGKATITALANDSSGRKAACTVTVTQQVTSITVSNNSKAAAGKSQTYKATVLPSTASNKKVKWTLLYASEEVTAQRAKELGVSINASSGKLTTTSKAVTGSYTVRATALDGSGISGSRVIRVVRGSITGITLTDKTYSKVTIFRKQQAYGTQTQTVIYARIKGTEDADMTAYEVTSSNPGIATVTSQRLSRPPAGQTGEESLEGENSWLKVTINATGTASGKSVVTIRATDGSNKKAVCTVTVGNPVSSIRIAPSGGNIEYMSKGKTLQMRAVVETENGTVLNKGVKWEVYGGKEVSISSGGRLKASKNASTGYYRVYAVAKDGSGVTASYTIGVVTPTTWIKLYSNGYLSTKKKLTIRRGGIYTMRVDSDSMINGYTVSSSNPAVVSGTFSSNNMLRIMGNKKGSATITVSALDGSGKKVKYRFKVK